MSKVFDSALMAECVQRAGWVKGPRLSHFVVDWRLAEIAHDGPIGIEEFGDWWTSKRTAYRRLAEFRAFFPEYSTPAEVPVGQVSLRPARGSEHVGTAGSH